MAAKPGVNSVKIFWNPPLYTGGVIVRYTVTTVEESSRTCVLEGYWSACTIPDLESGRTYSFTVQASNTAGVGPTSAPTQPVLCKGFPPGFKSVAVASGLNSPTALAIAPDGRVFIAEQGGRILAVDNDTSGPRVIAMLEVDSGSQRGLLGLAVDPFFAETGMLYAYYTAPSPARNRLSRIHVLDTLSEREETILFELDPREPMAGDHAGGGLAFGPDGKLYVGVGDHQQSQYAQDLSHPYGKVLRINRDGSFPEDNPYYDLGLGWNRAIWSYGMRNPFGLAFDPMTGELLAADVGEQKWEEVNQIVAGKNYGWPLHEGAVLDSDTTVQGSLHGYGHGEGCSIVGGDIPGPHIAPSAVALPGGYYFADFCGGWIRRLDPATGIVEEFADGLSWPTALRFSENGDLYYIAREHGYEPFKPVSVVYKVSRVAADSTQTEP